MRCPQCGTRDTRVVDSRDLDEAATIRRRRECPSCTARFTTYERVEAARLIVVKRDGTRQEFDRDKLADGLAQGAHPPAGRRRRRRPRRGRDRGRAARVGPVRDPELAGRRAGDGPAARARPHRVHPVRVGLPELRGPRGPQARGRLAVRREGRAQEGSGRARMSVLADRDIRDGARGGPGPDRPVRPGGPPAVVGRPPPRPQLPGVPQQPLRVHRPADAAARPHRAARRSATTSRSSSTRASSCSARPSSGSSCRTTSSRGSRARARWAAWGCSSTRPRATSTRAGRAPSRSSSRTSPTCRSPSTTACGSARSASSG